MLWATVGITGSGDLKDLKVARSVAEAEGVGTVAELKIRSGYTALAISGPAADMDATLARLSDEIAELRKEIAWHAEMGAEMVEPLAEAV